MCLIRSSQGRHLGGNLAPEKKKFLVGGSSCLRGDIGREEELFRGSTRQGKKNSCQRQKNEMRRFGSIISSILDYYLGGGGLIFLGEIRKVDFVFLFLASLGGTLWSGGGK